MNDSIAKVPPAENEVARSYAPGTPERAKVQAELERMSQGGFDIPLVIGGQEIRTGRTAAIGRPDEIAKPLGLYHVAGEAEAERAIASALAAKREWAAMPWEERAAVFRRAAALISGKRRATMVAATMLGQSKTVQQAEIDAVCEVVDFLRINPTLMERIYAEQPSSGSEEWNRLSYRPLEGFVYAVTPFNFTAIAANLATAPAMMGNVVLWKPASTSILSNYHLMKVYEEAGLPPGVINFVPGSGKAISKAALTSPDFAGLHFTGSTAVFNSLWKQVADNLSTFRSYPRIVGETGGKDFVFMDPSADQDAAIAAIVRGAFEYQGQKCSAASRLYLPRSSGSAFLERLAAELRGLRTGKVEDFRNFMAAVIDEASFDGIVPFLERAAASSSSRVLAGGKGDKAEGFFIEPTLIETTAPRSETMETEIFGPVLTAYRYDEGDMAAAYRLVDTTSPYALTGAILARDRRAILRGIEELGNSAGNLYINDKPTGAVVGRQPFGGMRASGTNDKAGSLLNLVRWTSAGTIKENFDPPTDWRYPYMSEA